MMPRVGRKWTSASLATIRRFIPSPVRYWMWQTRMLRSYPRLSAADIDRIYAQLLPKIDRVRLNRLRKCHRRSSIELREASDYEVKLRIAILKALMTGLHQSRALRILDLGSGGGYFVAVCRHLGHTAEGTEVPTFRLDAATTETYAELGSALRFECDHRLLIERGKALGLTATYDLITAHRICFNEQLRPSEWTRPEWRYFVEDVCNHIVPGGRLILELRENVARYGVRRWYDDDLAAYFASVGRITGNWITIDPDRRPSAAL
jgi:SAM-dependent methyltransferase